MNSDKLKEVISGAGNTKYVFLATADKAGLPHIAAGGNISVMKDGLLRVTSWFCPTTVVNLNENKRISLVIWDFVSDTGFQLVGEIKQIQEVGMLDGYAPKVESDAFLPQVERQLLVKVNKMMEFKYLPHTDKEIGE